MKKSFNLFVVFLFLSLFSIGQESRSYSSVIFNKDVILDLKTGLKYNGRLEEKYDNGKTKVVSLVKNGKLTGSTKIFYPSGQTKLILTYDEGELNGIITEYFSNGEMKFQAEVNKQSRYGGSELKGFLYCYYEGDRYKNKYKNSGRLELITGNGLSPFFNGHLSPSLVEGYRVFINKMSNFGLFIEDSRDIICPEAREPGVKYQNWAPGR